MSCICNNRLADAMRRGDRKQVEREIHDRLTGKVPAAGPVSCWVFHHSRLGLRVDITKDRKTGALRLRAGEQGITATDAEEAARLAAGVLLPEG